MDVFTGPRRNTHVVYSQYGAVGNEGIWDQMLVLPLPNCVLWSRVSFVKYIQVCKRNNYDPPQKVMVRIAQDGKWQAFKCKTVLNVQ